MFEAPKLEEQGTTSEIIPEDENSAEKENIRYVDIMKQIIFDQYKNGASLEKMIKIIKSLRAQVNKNNARQLPQILEKIKNKA